MSSTPCQCNGCTVPHVPYDCSHDALWYYEAHPVDNCEQFSGSRGYVCADCFQAVVDHCLRLIEWAIAEVRPPVCQGCNAPLTRLSDIIKEVVKL